MIRSIISCCKTLKFKIMAKSAPEGYKRLELWIPTQQFEYFSALAGHFKDRRKTYLEKVLTKHYEIMSPRVKFHKQLSISLDPKKPVTEKTRVTVSRKKVSAPEVKVKQVKKKGRLNKLTPKKTRQRRKK